MVVPQKALRWNENHLPKDASSGAEISRIISDDPAGGSAVQ
jgi:hypothetical protein